MTSTQLVPGVRIEDVRVGERARKDYGDLASLKASISEHGLLQPIVLLPDDYLLCGGRRLEACRQLGWEAIPFVRVADQGDAISRLLAERDENTCRKDMTPSELVAIGLKLEELRRPEAEARQREAGQLYGRGIDSSGPKDPDLSDGHSKRRDVAEAIGMSESTYKRAKRVVEAAEDADAPEEVRRAAVEAQSDMDAGRTTITAADQKVAAAKLAVSEPKRLPELERLAQIRELAPTGRTSLQIGAEIGIRETHVRRIAARHGVEIPADKVMDGTRRVDHTRFVSKTVEQIEAISTGLDAFNPGQVDWSNHEDWVASLTASMRALNRFVNTIRKGPNE